MKLHILWQTQAEPGPIPPSGVGTHSWHASQALHKRFTRTLSTPDPHNTHRIARLWYAPPELLGPWRMALFCSDEPFARSGTRLWLELTCALQRVVEKATCGGPGRLPGCKVCHVECGNQIQIREASFRQCGHHHLPVADRWACSAKSRSRRNQTWS